MEPERASYCELPVYTGSAERYGAQLFLAGVLLGLAFLPGCSSPISQPALPKRVVAAMLEGWEAAGLPEPPPECGLRWFAVAFPADEAAFSRVCPSDRCSCMPGACLYGWAAVIHPSERGPVVERLAVHELAHWLSYCTLGDMDYEHTNGLVFLPKGGTHNGSAEDVARMLLE